MQSLAALFDASDVAHEGKFFTSTKHEPAIIAEDLMQCKEATLIKVSESGITFPKLVCRLVCV